MGLMLDIFVGSAIGFIYNIIIHKFSDVITENNNFDSKMQQNLIILFFGGIFALFMAVTLFNNNDKFKNRAIRFGLYIGAALLFIHTLLYNWGILTNVTKIFIMSAIMGILIWYSYKQDEKITKNVRKERDIIEYD